MHQRPLPGSAWPSAGARTAPYGGVVRSFPRGLAGYQRRGLGQNRKGLDGGRVAGKAGVAVRRLNSAPETPSRLLLGRKPKPAVRLAGALGYIRACAAQGGSMHADVFGLTAFRMLHAVIQYTEGDLHRGSCILSCLYNKQPARARSRTSAPLARPQPRQACSHLGSIGTHEPLTCLQRDQGPRWVRCGRCWRRSPTSRQHRRSTRVLLCSEPYHGTQPGDGWKVGRLDSVTDNRPTVGLRSANLSEFCLMAGVLHKPASTAGEARAIGAMVRELQAVLDAHAVPVRLEPTRVPCQFRVVPSGAVLNLKRQQGELLGRCGGGYESVMKLLGCKIRVPQ